MAWSRNGELLASGSEDGAVRLWDSAGKHVRILEGHRDAVCGLAWSASMLASVSFDGTVRIWDVASGNALRTLEGGAWSVAWSPNGALLASASSKIEIRDPHSGSVLQTLESTGRSLAWSPDGSMLASPDLGNIKIWEATSGTLLPVLKGHFDWVLTVAWSPDGSTLASGSIDGTVRLWDPKGQRAPTVMEGHSEPVHAVRFSSDGRLLASLSKDGSVRLWRRDTGSDVGVIEGRSLVEGGSDALGFHPAEPRLAVVSHDGMGIEILEIDVPKLLRLAAPTSEYVNAKVVLVGDSGVGKTGLGLVLAGRPYVATESTHGRNVWTLDQDERALADGGRAARELLLWDMAGQPGYRVLHRQHLDEVAVGLVLFDARSETEAFTGVGYWARALDEATHGFPLKKFLVAARIDRGGPQVSRQRIEEARARWGFDGYFETSARRGDGIAELARAMREAVAWERVPVVRGPELFADVKGFLVREKEAGRVLATRGDLMERFRSTKREKVSADVFETCIGRVEAAGLIKRLSFGSLVLLQPELLDAYCAWLAQGAQREPDGLGFLPERDARAGRFPMDADRSLVGREEEALLLVATVEDLVARGIALRQPTDRGEMLIFPSEVRSDMLDYPGDFVRAVTFAFEGPVRAVYATLTVRLAHAPAFRRERFYRNAAVFRSVVDEACGFKVETEPHDDTAGRLTVFFSEEAAKTTKLTFLRYVNQQLEGLALADTVRRERVYQCVCGFEIPEAAVTNRGKRGETTAICPDCGRHTPIDDLAEQSAQADAAVAALDRIVDDEVERRARLTVVGERERGREYHAFLCHNSKDKPAVRRLAALLREQGVLASLDEEGILAGKQFVKELEQVIDTVASAVVIVGPHSMGPWQRQEYQAFLQRLVEHRGKARMPLALIPVLLPGAPTEPDLPVFLRGFHRVDFRRGLDDAGALRQLVRAVLGDHWERSQEVRPVGIASGEAIGVATAEAGLRPVGEERLRSQKPT